jgi:prophage antirepressor-like protein
MANQTNSIVPFLFEGEILTRVILRDGEPWFVATDVCRAIRVKQTTKALQALDDDEKGVTSIHTPGGLQDHLIVSESGYYTLILRSRAATTPGTVQHRFRRWVTAEVLPQLRKTGSYGVRPKRGLSPEQVERQLRINEWKAATNALDSIRRAAGNRPAALAAPAIFAALGIRIDLDASDTLAQGELPLAETAETVH